MTLPRWFLPLLWSTMRLYGGSLQIWSRPQYRMHGRLPAVRRDFSPSPLRPRVASPRLPYGRVLILALVGCLFAVLALGPKDVGSSVTGEAMSPQLSIGLGSGVGPVLSRAETQPLITMASLVSPSDASVRTDDCDAGDDDPSAKPILTITPHVIPPLPLCRGFNAATHANPWLSRYVVRPQLLTRL
jgi:hypothetical protein